MKAHPWIAQARVETPLGPITLAASDQGLAGLWFDGQKHHPGVLDVPYDAANPFIAQARDELRRYWNGDAHDGFRVPLAPEGTAFQQAVWRALRAIPAGHTCSYTAVAARAGVPHAVRAVGAAIGRNPLSIIVPCHRVLGRDGSLTGYAGGLSRKRALLKLEGAPRPIDDA